MEKEHDKTIKTLEAKKPFLNTDDKAVLWSRIAKETIEKEVIPSPYGFMVVFKKPLLAPVALALVLMLGTTGLVAASEPTRPGDTLFAVKQATESIRLALASDDTKTRLEAEFAAERLLELSSILEESLAEYRHNNASTSLEAKDEKRVNEALGITLSHLGKSGLSSSTKDSLYTELASLLQGAPVRIDDDRLRSYKNDAQIEIRQDKDDKRIEIRDGEAKLRIREKDGGLRIDYKEDWDDDDDDRNDDRNDDRDDEDKKYDRDNDRDDDRKANTTKDIHLEENVDIEITDDQTKTDRDDEDDDSLNEDHDDDRKDNNDDAGKSTSDIKIEVRVEEGRAEVRVDGDMDYEFTLPYTTKALLITTIAIRTGLNESLISDNLDIEYKD